jgi:hypothetical protein
MPVGCWGPRILTFPDTQHICCTIGCRWLKKFIIALSSDSDRRICHGVATKGLSTLYPTHEIHSYLGLTSLNSCPLGAAIHQKRSS